MLLCCCCVELLCCCVVGLKCSFVVLLMWCYWLYCLCVDVLGWAVLLYWVVCMAGCVLARLFDCVFVMLVVYLLCVVV